jgi:hypothetical protein
MKHILIIIIILSATFYNSNAQTILKKKEIAAKLEEVENEIKNKDFEKALNIFQSKNEVILKQNVRKKNIEQFEDISMLLSNKKKLFIKNEKKVEQYIKYYNNNKLCDACLLLSLNLTIENSFLKTRKEFDNLKPILSDIFPLCIKNEKLVSACNQDYNAYKYCDAVSCINMEINSRNAYSRTISDFKNLLPKIQEAESKCSAYSIKIKKWQMQYENKEFNKLLTSVLLIEPYEKRFIPTNDKVQFENLRRNLEIKNEEQKKAEQSLREVYIIPIESEIKEIKLGQLTYLKSQDYIELLSDLTNRLNKEIKNNPLKYDNIENEIKRLKMDVEKVLYDLKAYSEKNKPQYINLVKLYNDFAGEGMFGEPKYTDIQIEHFWKNDYKGKAIIATGTVYEIAETFFGSSTYITIQISTSHYVDLYLDSSEEDKLLGISKGQKVEFMGEIDHLGTGIMSHHSIKNVKILNIY